MKTMPVRVTKRARAAAESILKMWQEIRDEMDFDKRLSESKLEDSWYKLERRQALRDSLEAMKRAGLINDYSLGGIT